MSRVQIPRDLVEWDEWFVSNGLGPVQLYRMHDVNNRGAIETPLSEAQRWNEQGFGIFWTVNSFDGKRRIEQLQRINSWAIDIDEGSLRDQQRRIQQAPLVPSLIVKTKRGFQVYWHAKDGKAKHWNAIVLDRLVPFFGADPNARDLARILRVPGFKHLKDPAHPVVVEVLHLKRVAYTEADMLSHFPAPMKPQEDREQHEKAKRELKLQGDGFWDRVYNLDCLDGLERLSGHPAVAGERYSFKRTAKGGWNIYVDGKGSSCWVDGNHRIGSLDKGGPTLYQWLRWFRNSPRDCVRVLKELYPNLEAGQ